MFAVLVGRVLLLFVLTWWSGRREDTDCQSYNAEHNLTSEARTRIRVDSNLSIEEYGNIPEVAIARHNYSERTAIITDIHFWTAPYWQSCQITSISVNDYNENQIAALGIINTVP